MLLFAPSAYSATQCSDGIDNDGDGLVDLWSDLGCTSETDDSEGGTESWEIENGWTVFEPSDDSRIIYVSSSEGSDRWAGTDPENPLRSIGLALNRLRDGRPDWVLFKRGDTWNEGFSQLTKSGRSMEEPMLFGSYGDSKERPRFHPEDFAFMTFGGGNGPEFTDYLVFVGLHFSLEHRNPSSSAFNPTSGRYIVDWLRGTRGLHFEDTVFQWGELNFTSFDGFPQTNITFRRSQILDSWSPSSSSHAQGLYLSNPDGVLIKETLFDHNGWNPDAPGGERTIFNHNLYGGAPKNVLVESSAFLRGSSHGIQLRDGGIVRDSLFSHNAIGLFLVNRFPGSEVSGNVFLHGDDIGPGNGGRGWGIEIKDGTQAMELRNNIVSQCKGIGCSNISILSPNVESSGNIAYRWPGSHPQNPGPFPDPDRSLETYNMLQGGEGTIEDFSRRMREQSRLNWDDAYTIPTIVDYIRDGFSSD